MTLRLPPVAVLVLAALGATAPAGALDVRRLALEEVADRADRIVHGTVREVTSGRDADGLPATWVTLDVAECLKGHAAGTLTWKQVGVQAPLGDGTLLRVPGLPRYRPGEEVVIFLHAPSGRGFTSPVGLGQGLYRAERVPKGRAVRSGLTAGPPEELGAFLERVRRHVRR